MHGGSPAAASQRKTVKESEKEATLAPAGLIARFCGCVALYF